MSWGVGEMDKGLRVPEHWHPMMCLHVDSSCRKVQLGTETRDFWLLSWLVCWEEARVCACSVHTGTSGLGLLFTFPFQSTLLSPSLSDKSRRKSLLRFFGVAVDSNPFVPSTARITGLKYSRGAILGVPAWS